MDFQFYGLLGNNHAPPSTPTPTMSTISTHDLDFDFAALEANIQTNLTIGIEEMKTRNNICNDFITTQYRTLNSNMESSTRKIQELEKENDALKLKFRQLCNYMQESTSNELAEFQNSDERYEQFLITNDVEIRGLPEFAGEPLITIILRIAEKVGSDVKEHDIVNAMRLGPERTSYRATNATFLFRPRPVLVRLANHAARDNFLSRSRLRRGLTSAGLGIPRLEPANIYVNERLTKSNRILFDMVRQRCKDAGWRHTWVRDGNIYIRQNDTSRIRHIKSRASLDLFLDVD